MKLREGSLPGLDYVVGHDEHARCSLCGRGDAPLLFRKGGCIAICELCSHLSYLAWRRLAGEALPDLPESSRRVSTVAVLVARRRLVRRVDAPPDAPEAERVTRAPAELSSSYEFLLERHPDGEFLPPAAACGDGDVVGAALDALESVGASSWRCLLENLYVGYTPRGRLAAVVLATGWWGGESVERACEWRAWPPSRHAGAMSGFYQGVEAAWPLRTHKHSCQEEREELSVRMREAARMYVELQAALRSGTTADASMLVVYRSAMSDDEVAVAALVKKAAEKEREAESLARPPAPASPPLAAGDPGDSPSEDDGGEEGGEDAGAGGEVAGKPPEPGFARAPARREG